MDLNVCISALSVLFSWIFCTALTAPPADPPAAGHPAVSAQRHVRNKRCSCATFLDKECVYFCHLDIIWVNTPERVVSYGLGNVPRTRRALADPMGARGPRCQCVRDNDISCASFCLRRETTAEAARDPADARPAAAARGMDRTNRKGAAPLALRALLRTRLLLEKWRARRRHRSRVQQDDGALF